MTEIYIGVSRAIYASDYYFGRIGKGNTAVVATILLDANRQKTSSIGPLPLIHAFMDHTRTSIPAQPSNYKLEVLAANSHRSRESAGSMSSPH